MNSSRPENKPHVFPEHQNTNYEFQLATIIDLSSIGSFKKTLSAKMIMVWTSPNEITHLDNPACLECIFVCMLVFLRHSIKYFQPYDDEESLGVYTYTASSRARAGPCHLGLIHWSQMVMKYRAEDTRYNNPSHHDNGTTSPVSLLSPSSAENLPRHSTSHLK